MSKARVIAVEGGNIFEFRTFFKKTGRAKYISHLDLYRTIQRSFQRAKLPVWHTLGFNPHIYLTFPLPISLGYEGVNESFDFRLVTDMEPEEIVARLNAALPEGIVVTGMAAPAHKPEVIARAEYSLLLSGKELDGDTILAKWQEYMAQPEIMAEKRSKKGIRTVDLKTMIHAVHAEKEGNALSLKLTLTAGINLNLNPTLVTDTFAAWAGFDPQYHSIRRDRILCEDGKEFC